MKLCEVATFTFPNETDILESLLMSEGIEYFLENGNISSFMPGALRIGLLVKESDVDKTVELIKRAGFEKYLSSE